MLPYNDLHGKCIYCWMFQLKCENDRHSDDGVERVFRSGSANNEPKLIFEKEIASLSFCHSFQWTKLSRFELVTRANMR